MYSKRTTLYFIKIRFFENDINNDFNISLNKNENENNDSNDYVNSILYMKNFDKSKINIDTNFDFERKIKIDTKIIIFDEYNLIKISNYRLFDLENNIKYDKTILFKNKKNENIKNIK